MTRMLCMLYALVMMLCIGTARAEGEGLPYVVQEQPFSEGERSLYGRIYVPEQGDGEEKWPAVIFSHGFGGDHSVGEPYARALAGQGYVVYCFDFCGGSPGSRSSGSTLEMSIFTEVEDLAMVMDGIEKLPYVDADRLFLMGTSQGGVVSAILAAREPQRVKGLVLLYPAFVLVDTAQQMFDTPEEIPDTIFHLWMTVGRAYFEPLLDYDVYAEIAAYPEEVLILHGDQDSIVPLSYSLRALEAYPSARLETIHGAGHGFYGEDAGLALQYISDYLAARSHKE